MVRWPADWLVGWLVAWSVLRALLCFAKLRALLLKDRPPSKFRVDTFNLRALLCYLSILLAWFC